LGMIWSSSPGSLVFSGLVVTTGEVVGTRAVAGGLQLEVAATFPGESLRIGESIAVQGVCLTVARAHAGAFTVDVSAETLRRTTMGSLRRGGRVNLERALRLDDRLGGHLVLGHVDGTTRVLALTRSGAFATLRLALPAALAPEIAEKGSVAVDGVSLTVAALSEAWLEVALVPETLGSTTLGSLRSGVPVNLETDVLAKYVRRAVGGHASSLGKLLRGAVDASD
jgi:riboflavin synthase